VRFLLNNSRFLYAALCLLLIAWAASAQAPRYTVQDKTTSFTVVNKTTSCPCGPNCGCTPAQNCGCVTQAKADPGVITYTEVILRDGLGRPCLYLKPSKEGLNWIYKGPMASAPSYQLTPTPQASYTYPLQCTSGST
jgi:hypothetical protein